MAGIIANAQTTGTTPLDQQGTLAANGTVAPDATITPPASTTAPNTYNPAQLGQQTQWAVGADQTVQGQLQNILADNSPIIQQARSQAQQQANSRGLLNTSLAATAGESAAIQNALPIAQADAQTFAKAAGYNADTSNTFTQKNADITNTAAGFNAQQGQQAAQFNATAQNQNQQFNAAEQNKGQQFNAQQAQQNAQFNAGQGNATTLANIEAGYKSLMQTNASASDLYKQAMTDLQAIQNNPEMGAAAKQLAVDAQLNVLHNSLQVIGAISNLNLGDLVNFATPTDTTGTSTPPLAGGKLTLPAAPPARTTPPTGGSMRQPQNSQWAQR